MNEHLPLQGLVRSMTSLSPSDRLSCEHYLSDAYGRVFPESFYDYFHDFIAAMNEISSSWPPLSSSSLRSDAGTGTGTGTGASTPQQQQQQQQAAETPSSLPLPSNADEIIGRIWADFDQMESHFSGRPEPKVDNPASLDERTQDRLTATDASLNLVQWASSLSDLMIRFSRHFIRCTLISQPSPVRNRLRNGSHPRKVHKWCSVE